MRLWFDLYSMGAQNLAIGLSLPDPWKIMVSMSVTLAIYTFGAINKLSAKLNDPQLVIALWKVSNIAYNSEHQGWDLSPTRPKDALEAKFS